MSLQGLTRYYTDLLAFQYRNRARARQQIALWSKQVVADFVAEQVASCFNVDTAVGRQLDVIGKYVGVPRNIGLVTSRPYFGFWPAASFFDPADYQGTWNPTLNSPALPAASGGNTGYWYVISVSGESTTPVALGWQAGDVVYSDGSTWLKTTNDNGNGFTTSSNAGVNQEGVFYSYNYSQGQNSDLTDAEYRTVIKLKAILNGNDGTLASIMAYLNQFFPGQISLVDNRSMFLAYSVLSTVTLSKELLAIYLPRPMGVGISVTIVTPTPPSEETEITTEDGFVIGTEDDRGITT